MENIQIIWKERGIVLGSKVKFVKTQVFPIVFYGASDLWKEEKSMEEVCYVLGSIIKLGEFARMP